MRHVGIDLHRKFLVVCVVDGRGRCRKPRRFECRDVEAIRSFFEKQGAFQAVIEASGGYRWLHDLLAPLGKVVLAHALRLRAIVSGRAKTDKLDAALLGKLLRAGLIPESYVPPQDYQELRDFTRGRSRLSRRMTQAKNEMHALLRARNLHSPYATTLCKRGLAWIRRQDLGMPGNVLRDELLLRMKHFESELARFDGELERMAERFPEVEALTCLHGIGLFSALLIVAEIGEPERFTDGRKVGAYAGLTARVSQSGESCHHGHITHQGSPWLRWILVEAAMRLVRRDRKLNNFHTRIRKRSSASIARVAVARKLAGICWVRLKNWRRVHAA